MLRYFACCHGEFILWTIRAPFTGEVRAISIFNQIREPIPETPEPIQKICP